MRLTLAILTLIALTGACSTDGTWFETYARDIAGPTPTTTRPSAAALPWPFGDDGDSTETAEVDSAATDAALELEEASRADIGPRYRLRQFTAQQFEFAVGPTIGVELDPDRPFLTGSVTPGGIAVVVDRGALRPEGEPAHDDPLVEIWSSPSSTVVDTRALPDVDLAAGDRAILAPGLASIDGDTVEVDEVVAALTGVGLVEPSWFGALPFVLRDIGSAPGEEGVVTGRVSTDVALELFGVDVEAEARGIAGLMVIAFPMDIEIMTEVYRQAFRRSVADVRVELEDGRITAVAMDADVSVVFDLLAEAVAEAPPVDHRDYTDIEEFLIGGRYTIQHRVEVEEIAGLELEPAPEAEEDRTDVWLDEIRSSGRGR